MLKKGITLVPTIDITQEQAEALKSKAANLGLTLEEWIHQLADPTTPRNRRSRYTLEELVAACNPNTPRSAEDLEWLTDAPVGREAV